MDEGGPIVLRTTNHQTTALLGGSGLAVWLYDLGKTVSLR